MTRTLLDSDLSVRCELLHLDTSDRRDVRNIGRLDPGNVWLAIVHGTRFFNLLARSAVDVVYVPLSQNSLGFLRDALFLVPAIAGGVPVVLHLHGGRYDDFIASAPVPVRWLARSVFRHAFRVIVLGESLRSMLSGIAAPSNVVVVPNGVVEPIAPDVPQRAPRAVGTGAGRRTMHVLFLGNLIPGKGYIELLHATQQLLDDGVDMQLTFAGGVADDAAHARALASVRYGPDRIRFAGSVDAVSRAALLRAADVAVLPTYYSNEAHPLVLLEAMAAGLPLISTRHAAIPEIIVDGVTGVLIEPRSVDDLAAALRRLASDAALREAMGSAGRQRYEEKFTAERWSERMAAVFEAAAASRNATASGNATGAR